VGRLRSRSQRVLYHARIHFREAWTCDESVERSTEADLAEAAQALEEFLGLDVVMHGAHRHSRHGECEPEVAGRLDDADPFEAGDVERLIEAKDEAAEVLVNHDREGQPHFRRSSSETPGAQRDRIVRELRRYADARYDSVPMQLCTDAADLLDRAMSFIAERKLPESDADPFTQGYDRGITRNVYALLASSQTHEFRIVGVCPACFQVCTENMPITVEAQALWPFVPVLGARMVVEFARAWNDHLEQKHAVSAYGREVEGRLELQPRADREGEGHQRNPRREQTLRPEHLDREHEERDRE
jgi:hypothetical protein